MDPNNPQDQQQANNKQEASPKQSVVARVQQSQNVLVTVKTDPSVDELAATIGMTLLLNKLGKHATAVFSGSVPSTLEFLKPEETLETNTDSLRDFIISLDKAKADKLRYKVEENVVKIFITPYRTSITQDDLEFTQGDFNVDVVLALGVTKREELDQAIMAHGRILHDASVITITAGQDYSELGQINWQEQAASSLSEMLVSISEAFGGGLIDQQIATAFLTGIVSETERFSNTKTSPKVMTMAAQLMAAGANQQLIANELDKTVEVDINQPADNQNPDSKPGDISISEDGSLTIAHNEPEPQKDEEPPVELPEPVIEEQGNENQPEGSNEQLTPPSEQERSPLLPKPEDEKTELVNPLLSEDTHKDKVSEDQNQKTESDTGPIQKAEEPIKAPEEPKSGPEIQPGNTVSPANRQNNGNIHIDEEGNLITKPHVEPKHKVINPLPPVDLSQSVPPENPGTQDNSNQEDYLSETKPKDNFESKLPPPPKLDLTPSKPINDNTTIQEIEESVNSPHLQESDQQNPVEGVDTARDAVMSAINQSEFDPARSPRTDLNAMPLGAPPEPKPFDDYRLSVEPDNKPHVVSDVSGNLSGLDYSQPNENTVSAEPEMRSQTPGGMELHTLGEVVPENQNTNSIPPPPVPPPMMPS